MDLDTFKNIVDGYPDSVTPLKNDPEALYAYLGLSAGSARLQRDLYKEFYRQIALAFTAGHQAAWDRVRELREELIQRHVLDGQSLDPYFSVLDHLQDALRGKSQTADEIQGDWVAAIHHAHDSVRINDWSAPELRERTHTRF